VPAFSISLPPATGSGGAQQASVYCVGMTKASSTSSWFDLAWKSGGCSVTTIPTFGGDRNQGWLFRSARWGGGGYAYVGSGAQPAACLATKPPDSVQKCGTVVQSPAPGPVAQLVMFCPLAAISRPFLYISNPVGEPHHAFFADESSTGGTCYLLDAGTGLMAPRDVEEVVAFTRALGSAQVQYEAVLP